MAQSAEDRLHEAQARARIVKRQRTRDLGSNPLAKAMDKARIELLVRKAAGPSNARDMAEGMVIQQKVRGLPKNDRLGKSRRSGDKRAI